MANNENCAVPELNGRQGQFMAWWPKGMADKPPHGRRILIFSTSFLAFTIIIRQLKNSMVKVNECEYLKNLLAQNIICVHNCSTTLCPCPCAQHRNVCLHGLIDWSDLVLQIKPMLFYVASGFIGAQCISSNFMLNILKGCFFCLALLPPCFCFRVGWSWDH